MENKFITDILKLKLITTTEILGKDLEEFINNQHRVGYLCWIADVDYEEEIETESEYDVMIFKYEFSTCNVGEKFLSNELMNNLLKLQGVLPENISECSNELKKLDNVLHKI